MRAVWGGGICLVAGLGVGVVKAAPPDEPAIMNSFMVWAASQMQPVSDAACSVEATAATCYGTTAGGAAFGASTPLPTIAWTPLVSVSPTAAATTSIAGAPATTAAPPATTAVSAPAPTTTPPTTAPGGAPIASFSGEGTQLVELGIPVGDIYVMDVEFTAAGDGFLDSITITELDSSFGNEHQAVWWYDGSQSGRVFLGAFTDAAYLQVEADGAWSIVVWPITAVEEWPGGEAHGVGPDVLRFTGTTGAMTFAHQGDGNFVVAAYGSDGDRQTVINEIDSVEGTSFMPASPAFVVVDAMGEWWLRVG